MDRDWDDDCTTVGFEAELDTLVYQPPGSLRSVVLDTITQVMRPRIERTLLKRLGFSSFASRQVARCGVAALVAAFLVVVVGAAFWSTAPALVAAHAGLVSRATCGVGTQDLPAKLSSQHQERAADVAAEPRPARHLVFLVHATEQIEGLYRRALAERVPGAELHIVNSPFGVRASSYRHLMAYLRVRYRAGYLDALVRHAGADSLAHYDTITVASFSAGYAAVREMLDEPESAELIDAVVAIDSWHAEFDRDGSARDSQLAGLARFARQAATGPRLCWFRHTDVKVDKRAPYVFASTTEVASELRRLTGLPRTGSEVWEGGLRISAVNERADDFAEHVAALTVWGDDWLADAVAALLERRAELQ
jgi:hypothetical protein